MLKLLAFGLITRIPVLGIVGGTPLRIAQGLISVGNETEPFGVPRFPVIWMKPLGLHAIDAMDSLLIGVRADLKGLVVIDEH